MKENIGNKQIDLYHLWYFFLEFINRIILFFKKIIKITIKKIVYIIVLLIASISLGFYLDSIKVYNYDQEVILIPNFESSSHLYDVIYNYKPLKNSPIIKLQIEPIVDIYEFVSKPENLKSAEYFTENNINITSIKKGSQSEKIYKYHLLKLTTRGKDKNEKIVKSFLSDLNKEPHFLSLQKVFQKNNKLKLKETLKSIDNTNAIFEKLSKSTQTISGKSDFNIEMYPELNGLLDTKQRLLDNVKNLEQKQIEQEKVFYDVSIIPNIETSNIKYIYLIPFITILFFYIIILLKNKRNFNV